MGASNSFPMLGYDEVGQQVNTNKNHDHKNQRDIQFLFFEIMGWVQIHIQEMKMIICRYNTLLTVSKHTE